MLQNDKGELTVAQKQWLPIRAEPTDLPQISLFFKRQYRGYGSYGSMDLFHWKIFANSLSQGYINLIKDGPTIASTTSITPKEVLIGSKTVASAEIGDTFTGENYQRQGMFALLVNESRANAEEKGIQLIYGTPNNQSLPGYLKKLGFGHIPGLDVRGLILPLSYRIILGGRVKRAILDLIHPILKFFESIFLFLVLFRNRGTSAISVRECEGLDPIEWEDFWNRSKGKYDFILNRSSDYVRWRFFESPNRYRFKKVYENGTMIGFVVLREIEDRRTFRWIIADYLFDSSSESALKIALQSMIKEARIAGIEAISVWCERGSPYFPIFRKYGFIDRYKVSVIAYKNLFFDKLASCKQWHFTTADSDNV